jgi:hypothetical protein
MLRANRVRLNCYLNAEGVGVNVIGGPRGHGTIVMLPTECDTLEEVLPLIQLKLKLADRMMFASDLFLTDGTLIVSFEQLLDAAAIDAPIIVGCGEPFDGSRIPHDLAAIQNEGGGRQGLHRVTGGLEAQRKAARADRAEQVREAGHGVLPNSLAVVTARSQAVEANREKAAMMRQHYMESLVRRSADQEDLKFCARQNIQWHRMEKEESRIRQEEKAAERMERLQEERMKDKRDAFVSKREDAARAKAQHDRVKSGESAHKLKKKEYPERYRRAARTADFGTRPGQETAAAGTY